VGLHAPYSAHVAPPFAVTKFTNEQLTNGVLLQTKGGATCIALWAHRNQSRGQNQSSADLCSLGCCWKLDAGRVGKNRYGAKSGQEQKVYRNLRAGKPAAVQIIIKYLTRTLEVLLTIATQCLIFRMLIHCAQYSLARSSAHPAPLLVLRKASAACPAKGIWCLYCERLLLLVLPKVW